MYIPGSVAEQTPYPVVRHGSESDADVHPRPLDADNPAVVGDFGCGAGWASIALAADLPHLRIVGIDNDKASVTAARRTASNTTSPTGPA
jgi:methylase of polypeptide subunit release factors